MKIAFIINAIDQEMTGVGVYSKALVESFIDTFPKFKYFFIDYKEKFLNDFKSIYKARIILIKNKFLTKKKSIWFNYLAFKLRNYDFDYIFNLTGTPHLLKFLQKEVLIIHDLHPILHPEFTSFKTYLYNKLFFRLTLRQAYKIIVNSEQTKTELLKYFSVKENKIFKIFIPPTIKKPLFYNNTKNDFLKKIVKKPFILYIGNLDLRKNLFNLIKAFYKIKKEKKFFEYKMVLVGKPGVKYKKIKNFIQKDKNYSKDIILTGYLPDSDKYYLLSKCKVFVYLSFYEGLGIPIFEAAYFGKPIVSSNVPIIDEIFKKTILTVDTTDVDNISQVLFSVINGDYPRNWICINQQKALAIAKNSTIQEQVKQLRSFLVH